MGDALWKRLQLLVSVLSVLLVLALLTAGLGWWRLRASLPPLDGARPLAGLTAPVRVERDALGVPTLTGASRLDVARATGFVHAQDRFFQMDLMRRSGAGELAELFGPAAVPMDQANRLHDFRATADRVLAGLPPADRALLEAYAAGVNAGLASLPRAPWEYAVLRADPQPWRPADSLLVVYAMWFDLQDATAGFEFGRAALRDAAGTAALEFLSPRGTSWDSALDGSTFPPAAPPSRSLRPSGTATPAPAEAAPTGSNAFALAGVHAGGGAALLASDMHLNLQVPHIWYRAVLAWTDAAGAARRLVGVTLPGVPALVAGSNGRVAWGFTVAYVDSADVVALEPDSTAQAYYRTPDGYREFEERTGLIRVKGGDPVPFTARWTRWGPVISPPGSAPLHALRWNAHDPEATNLVSFGLETADSVAEAVAIAHRSGVPNLNLIAADSAGHIAWTLAGLIPRRLGHDGRLPVSWAYGDRSWDGWLPPEEIPVFTTGPAASPATVPAAEGFLWSANHRMVGGEAYAKIGDGGYFGGARGLLIRDGLRTLVATGRPAVPADLLAIQLDDRALFLERWQRLLLGVLTDEAVAARPARADLRAAVRQWGGRATPDSAAYRLVRAWRLRLVEHALAPWRTGVLARLPRFNPAHFQFEDALWLLASERPAHLLNPAFSSWDALLLQAADDVLADTDRAGLAPARWTWGGHNTLRMRHPFSHFLPAWLGRFLDMPADPLPGGSDMPRMQSPTHGASQRLVVAPGREEEGLFHMPGGQSGNPLSPFYRAGHAAWVKGEPTPLLPGTTKHTLTLNPE
jgi:penicillin G amidase